VKVYLAARFSDRHYMELVADRLKTHGFEITSRWVYGGEEGLTREQIAVLDIDDVDTADAVISFTQPFGTMTKGGGRHVEFGYGMARGKRLILIGERENVFHHFPGVEIYATLDDFLAAAETLRDTVKPLRRQKGSLT
jgi:nucleoside 2-deoxyribosyltransferase